MDKKPNSIWKKSRILPPWLRAWLLVTGATFLALIVISQFLPGGPREISDWMVALTVFLAAGGVIAAIFLGVWACIRRLCCRRNFKRFLFGLACFATLVALFYAEEDWRGWHAWNQFKKEWAAKGEKFDFKDFVPPAVPDEENFALTPVVASCYEYILDKSGHKLSPQNTNVVNRLDFDLADDYGYRNNGKGYWEKGTLTDLKPRLELFSAKTNLFPVLPRSPSPAADVLLALSKFDATVEELRQASLLPESRFPLNYDTECSADILLPHLAAMKRPAQLLQLRAIAELQNGQSEKALADVKLTLRLTEAIHSEPFLISQLVRIAMVEIILQPIYEGLANRQWTDAQMVALDAELAKLNFLADYKNSVRGELGAQSSVFDFLRRHPGELANLSGEGNRKDNTTPLPFRFIPTGWFYQNQLRAARFTVQNYLPIADEKQQTASPAALRRADALFESEVRHATPYNFVERMLLPALGSCVKKCAREQISVDLARTAIALERYRLAHAEFPESLAALAPQFIAQVPHDVIGGGPLHYRRTGDGLFVLYSVGWNERDGGGVTGHRKGGTAPDFESGDWVWRYPAE